MDNNPNNPMTWRDLAKFLLDRTSNELKKPISIVWENEDEIANWASGTDQQYKSDGQRFYLPKLVFTRLFFCPTDDDSDCEMAIVVSPEFVKPKKRYTVRIHRAAYVDVFAENEVQAEEIGRKLEKADVPSNITLTEEECENFLKME